LQADFLLAGVSYERAGLLARDNALCETDLQIGHHLFPSITISLMFGPAFLRVSRRRQQTAKSAKQKP
jgi:hypothetical protein